MSSDCSEDVYGNKYNLLLFYNFHQGYNFLICTIIMLYFNFKYYIIYVNIKENQERSLRKSKMQIITILNILYGLFYFMIQDELLNNDYCLFIKILFIFLVVDVFFESFLKVLKYLSNFYEVFVIFFVDWLVMGALIEVLFISNQNYFDHEEYYSFNFGNYFKSLFSVFIFFTGNNSPEIMIKNYPDNSELILGFISLIWINNLLITGLIVGLSYYKMKLCMS